LRKKPGSREKGRVRAKKLQKPKAAKQILTDEKACQYRRKQNVPRKAYNPAIWGAQKLASRKTTSARHLAAIGGNYGKKWQKEQKNMPLGARHGTKGRGS